jgi:hypothetical protein
MNASLTHNNKKKSKEKEPDDENQLELATRLLSEVRDDGEK